MNEKILRPFLMVDDGDRDRHPEYRFLTAILVRGILDLLSNERHVARDTRIWFLCSGRHSFGYRWICDILEIDPGMLLRELRRIGCFKLDREKRPLELRKKLGAFISNE